ncbi:MAG: UDP-N-acetylglucosamine 1-carboxyvinyltransferase [Firmicutes bacterium]|nr:UDP-N-acetylglucosamine 1-carboxyvinyltransferase [Bacillota bacterium]
MGKYFITGQKKIDGSINLIGSKNSALPILAATVLNSGENIIHNCPDISDTHTAMQILKYLGCKVKYQNHTAIINSSSLNKFIMPKNLVKKMRSSIIFMGSLLSRLKKIKINYPGGCSLGNRPIDLHLNSLKKLGVKIFDDQENIICEAKNLKPTTIKLKFPSVGATQNIILASIFIKGETKIINPAREPEIIDLQNFLKKMGANINGAGTNQIIIRGVKKLNNTEHTIIPDRIVAGTFLLAAIITHGQIQIKKIIPHHLPLINFVQLGSEINLFKNTIILKAPKKINPIKKLITKPYPGFPTDLQAQFVSVLSLAHGKSFVQEKIFDARNKHIQELIKTGAKIKILKDNSSFIINGVKKIYASDLISKDLRGGASLILAGLAAQGQTIIHDQNFISRGYENISRDLNNLGAQINFFN